MSSFLTNFFRDLTALDFDLLRKSALGDCFERARLFGIDELRRYVIVMRRLLLDRVLTSSLEGTSFKIDFDSFRREWTCSFKAVSFSLSSGCSIEARTLGLISLEFYLVKVDAGFVVRALIESNIAWRLGSVRGSGYSFLRNTGSYGLFFSFFSPGCGYFISPGPNFFMSI
jgi:hypothetical protein